MRETRVWFRSQKDPLEKEIATHSILAPWTEELGDYSPRGRTESDTTERLLFIKKTMQKYGQFYQNGMKFLWTRKGSCKWRTFKFKLD